MRVNPSEQQQEGQGRGRKEREKRGGSKRVAKGASSGLPGWARLENTGGGGQRETEERKKERGREAERVVLEGTEECCA